MNVLNAEEMEFNVLIEGLVLVAFARGPIGHGIDLQHKHNVKAIYIMFLGSCICFAYTRSRIHDVHVIGVCVCLSYGLQHLLILQTACTETRQRLAAAANGRLLIDGNALVSISLSLSLFGRAAVSTLLLCK